MSVDSTIHIIGPGVVGKATGEGFRRFGFDIVYTDKGERHGFVEAGVHFVCTPEGAAPDVVIGLAKDITGGNRSSSESIVVRSSVLPGTCDRLTRETGLVIVHNPEFLREAVAGYEFLDSNYAVVGGAFYNSRVRYLYERAGKHVLMCSSTESELLKLVVNCYLATQISFWNAVKQVADSIGVNSHTVARFALHDSRVSRYGAVMHGAKYGGKCLPKDMEQLMKLTKGYASEFFTGVKSVNDGVDGVE